MIPTVPRTHVLPRVLLVTALAGLSVLPTAAAASAADPQTVECGPWSGAPAATATSRATAPSSAPTSPDRATRPRASPTSSSACWAPAEPRWVAALSAATHRAYIPDGGTVWPCVVTGTEGEHGPGGELARWPRIRSPPPGAAVRPRGAGSGRRVPRARPSPPACAVRAAPQPCRPDRRGRPPRGGALGRRPSPDRGTRDPGVRVRA